MQYIVVELNNNHLPQIVHINRLTGACSWTDAQFSAELRIEDAVSLGVFDVETNILTSFLFARLITSEDILNDPSQTDDADELEIFVIATHPDHLRKGLAGLLLHSCLKKLTNNTVIFLEVRSSNRGALIFYRKNGFLEVGKRRNYYQNPNEDAILMKLTVTDKISTT